MKCVVLVHWNADEAEARAKDLRSQGFDVSVFADQKANLRSLLDRLPDAFVISLTRAPSQGREIGGWLRRQKASRCIPLVFIEGDPDKTERVRDLLPDASFATWDAAVKALECAISHPPDDPVIPGAMEAYAGASLVKKLGIREGALVALAGAPDGFEGTLEDLPKGVRLIRDLDEAPDVLLLFVRSQEELDRGFPALAKRLAQGGKLWICWPKKASGVPSDLSQTIVRGFGLAREFVDYKISSIDEIWSGLCFARRTGKT